MSTLGKVLAALNVLAAGAFLAVASMDYAARQTWAYSAFRHQLAVDGLPLTETDSGWRPTGRLVSDLSANTLADLFRAAGGNPVPTQVDEVESLRQSILAAVEQAGNEKDKRELLAKILLPTAKTADYRDRLQAMIDPASKQRKPVAEILESVLIPLFNDVLQQAKSDLPRDTRRAEIADLLYSLALDQQSRNRVQVVVGLDQFVAAADRQAQNLVRMIEREKEAIADDESAFVRQYEGRLPRLQQLADQLRAAETRSAEQRKLIEQHTGLVNARRAEVDSLTAQLRKTQAEADQAMADLAAVQQQLFDLQKELVAGRAANAKLETRIRDAEGGR